MRIIGNRGNTARKVQAVASGALASGDTVIVNADGTVSVVAGAAEGVGSPVVFEAALIYNMAITYDSNTEKIVVAYRDMGNGGIGTAAVGTVSGTSISFGTPVVFETGEITDTACTYDANAQKVVISYGNDSNSGYGTAIVGTVSGTSISFGTAVVFESASATFTNSVYESNAQKVVIAYRDGGNSNYGTAIVGTVSGTNISFGTPVVFESAFTLYIAITFDSNSNKVVIAYRDNVPDYGTAIVGTVSGTNISFGTAVVYNTASSNWTSATFDSNSNKVVIAYRDGGNSDHGTAIVGTVSGTGISFGTAVVFESAATSEPKAVFDSNANKVVISYVDGGNSYYGTIITGTVSGTSISFDDPIIFEEAVTNTFASTFDSSANKVVTAYRDDGNSNYGTGIVFQTGSTNLTAENYIGIASNGYATGQAATINAKGFIDDNQSSLTAGQSYFVQTNGDLGLTAADPSVFAGTAVSATKLIVKG